MTSFLALHRADRRFPRPGWADTTHLRYPRPAPAETQWRQEVKGAALRVLADRSAIAYSTVSSAAPRGWARVTTTACPVPTQARKMVAGAPGRPRETHRTQLLGGHDAQCHNCRCRCASVGTATWASVRIIMKFPRNDSSAMNYSGGWPTGDSPRRRD